MEELEEEVCKRYSSGESIASIGRSMPVSREFIRRTILIDFGRDKTKEYPVSSKVQQKVIEMFESGCSVSEIKSKLQVGRRTVSRCIILAYSANTIKQARDIRDSKQKIKETK